MNIKDKIKEQVKKITAAHKAGKFLHFIEDVRFPFFKNLSPEAKITFDFPLTVLVGVNGSGKSSALHGIYGCPEGYSTGTHWFTTPLDPIKEDKAKGEIPSVIYSYKEENKTLEVLKRRSGVAKGLDYWETSRPLKIYGMKRLAGGKRNPPLEKKVTFLDFRSELSAFDKFFHFGHFNRTKNITSKQDYLRKYSVHVKDAFTNDSIVKKYSMYNLPLKTFGDNLISNLSNILGKPYSYCSILFHNFYKNHGATVLFNYGDKKYSEAFAGRGEFAVAKLIYEIDKAPVGSLILLDEPEVSLHPSAQEGLKIFLLEACLKKKLQIVLSTHSPKLIEFLPDEAIKLFYEQEDGKFNILNNCSYHRAFHQIGERIDSENKKIIVVEDSIAKELLDGILTELEDDYNLLFATAFYPGGAEAIYKATAYYSQENEKNKFAILDGDKRKPQHDPNTFTVEEAASNNFLERKIKQVTNCDYSKLGFRLDGNNNAANQEQKSKVLKNYLAFNNTHVAYLPLNIPEEIIWDEEYANKLLAADDNIMPDNIGDYKEKFKVFSELFNEQSTSEAINTNQKKFVKNFITKKNEHYDAIVEIINQFKDLENEGR